MTADVLRAVAAHGLIDGRGAWPDAPLGDAAWQGLLAGVQSQRLGGLLLAAVRAGDLPTEPHQRAQVAEHHLERSCSALVLERLALQAIDLLQQHGLEVRLLKGSATAHLDYEDPSLRLFADVDLLIRSRDVDAAYSLLTRCGYLRRSVEPRPGFDRRFGKGATFTAPDGHELDVHRTFVMGPYGVRITLDDLWERSDRVRLGGREVQALDPECRLLHACFHTALGDQPPRLVPQRDIAELLLRTRPDTARVRRLMTAWGAEPVVARAVRTAWHTLGLAPDSTELSQWAVDRVPTAQESKDLAVYTDPRGSSYAAKSVAALAALPRLRDKAALGLALALPRAGFVPDDEAHHAVPPWRRALKAGVRRVRP